MAWCSHNQAGELWALFGATLWSNCELRHSSLYTYNTRLQYLIATMFPFRKSYSRWPFPEINPSSRSGIRQSILLLQQYNFLCAVVQPFFITVKLTFHTDE